MPSARMTLEVLVPYQVFGTITGVSRIVAETREGSFGILPHRLDCVAALAPGILTYSTQEDEEVFLATDEGVLVKTGQLVRVSVRRAIAGQDLAQLRAAVDRDFLALDDDQQQVRVIMAKLETGFLRRMAAIEHD